MVWRRMVFMAILLVMALLISSQVADARDLTQTTPNRVLSKESEKIGDDLVGTDEYDCENGCCGAASTYCRCC